MRGLKLVKNIFPYFFAALIIHPRPVPSKRLPWYWGCLLSSFENGLTCLLTSVGCWDITRRSLLQRAHFSKRKFLCFRNCRNVSIWPMFTLRTPFFGQIVRCNGFHKRYLGLSLARCWGSGSEEIAKFCKNIPISVISSTGNGLESKIMKIL